MQCTSPLHQPPRVRHSDKALKMPSLISPTPRHRADGTVNVPISKKQLWQLRLPIGGSSSRNADGQETLGRDLSRASANSGARARYGDKWWQILWFRGMWDDIKRRAPHYRSDWADAWDYRVVPATVYMYFAKYVCLNKHNDACSDLPSS